MRAEIRQVEEAEIAEDTRPSPEEPLPLVGNVPLRRNPSAEWEACPSAGARAGIAVVVASLVAVLATLIYAVGRPVALDSFVAGVVALAGLLVALYAGVATMGCRSLRYDISSTELTIRWLGLREVIPLGRIEGLYGGHRLGERSRVEGFHWPGHHVGRTRAEGLGRLKFYGTTLHPEDALIVATSEAGYALTPSDPEGFRTLLIQRLEAMPAEAVEQAPEARTDMPRWMGLTVLGDGIIRLCGLLALLVLLASFGYVAARFPGLPELMPLHFNFAGEPDLIGPPRDAFRMPLIGSLILVVNLAIATVVHGRQRATGRLLMAATVFVQVVMLIAVLRVVH